MKNSLRKVTIAFLAAAACGAAGCADDGSDGSEGGGSPEGDWVCALDEGYSGNVAFTVTGSSISLSVNHVGSCDLEGSIQDNAFAMSDFSEGLGYNCAAEGSFSGGTWHVTNWEWAGNQGTATTCERQ
jgi:hypothetical protein